jgi:hypothetical protein
LIALFFLLQIPVDTKLDPQRQADALPYGRRPRSAALNRHAGIRHSVYLQSLWWLGEC